MMKCNIFVNIYTSKSVFTPLLSLKVPPPPPFTCSHWFFLHCYLMIQIYVTVADNGKIFVVWINVDYLQFNWLLEDLELWHFDFKTLSYSSIFFSLLVRNFSLVYSLVLWHMFFEYAAYVHVLILTLQWFRNRVIKATYIIVNDSIKKKKIRKWN